MGGGTTNTISSDETWVDDALPAGASPDYMGGDTWDWVGSSPTPELGSLSHQSAVALGLHQHFFTGATTPLVVNTGDLMYTYIYVDPNNIPSEVMLQWNDGSSWEHRAYWGANEIPWGIDGTTSLTNMGRDTGGRAMDAPASPKASTLGLEKALPSAAWPLPLYGGRAAWDNSGKSTATSTNSTNKGRAVEQLRLHPAPDRIPTRPEVAAIQTQPEVAAIPNSTRKWNQFHWRRGNQQYAG